MVHVLPNGPLLDYPQAFGEHELKPRTPLGRPGPLFLTTPVQTQGLASYYRRPDLASLDCFRRLSAELPKLVVPPAVHFALFRQPARVIPPPLVSCTKRRPPATRTSRVLRTPAYISPRVVGTQITSSWAWKSSFVLAHSSGCSSAIVPSSFSRRSSMSSQLSKK